MKNVFLFFPLTALLMGCTPTPPDKPTEVPADILASGLKVYTANCATCHQVDGSGVPNMQPPLAQDAVVNGDTDLLIRVVLQAPANALPPNHPGGWDNIMPSFSQLNDQQIADLLTYVRHSFGNQAGPVDVNQVQAIRAQLKL